ncbi:MAG: GntR family transcriptional regulator, partial [Alphaproteobacteria bacterium]|nr:GntR family transcriptional regulator [Alphaproteobacteria bacterium]
RAAVSRHLDFVERALSDQQKAERNEEIARKRLDHVSGSQL